MIICTALATSSRRTATPFLRPPSGALYSLFRYTTSTKPTAMASLYTNGNGKQSIPSRGWSVDTAPSIKDFAALCEQQTTKDDYPLSAAVEKNIPIYDLSSFAHDDAATVEQLKDEWNHILLSGPGVFALRNLYTDHALLSTVNTVFDSIILAEASSAKGDHFATSAANSRIWNSFSKHCLASPASFASYYSNPWLPHIFTSWLGPSSRLTAQLNIVRPGGSPQVSHRDYHLGFQTAGACAQFPAALQVASQLLTLQGAVAHSDMPLASGPTRFLPHSQRFAPGYMAYRRPEFDALFRERWVSLPLRLGDGVFFNPALFHAAGANESADVHRSANLLQISSAFGKPMETVDALPLVAQLRQMREDSKA